MGPWALNKSCSAGPNLVRSTFKFELGQIFLGPGRKIRRGRSLAKFLAGFPPKLSDISKFRLKKDPWALNKSCSAGPILVRLTFSGQLGRHFWFKIEKIGIGDALSKFLNLSPTILSIFSKFSLRKDPWALNKSCSAGPILVRSTFSGHLGSHFWVQNRKNRHRRRPK